MKKGVLIIIALSLLLISGCVKSANIIPTDNTNKAPSPNTTTNQNTSSGLNIQAPSFFFKSGVTEINYKGTFMFDETIKKDVKLHIIEVANLRYGKWYELKLDPIDGIPNDRLSLGYFHVNKDKIYIMAAVKENLAKIISCGDMPQECLLVCQDEELKDSLEKEAPGLHQYIEAKGNTREYHSYNNQGETGFYESFTWEKNKGLISFKSGYGAQRDEIELFINNK